MGFSANKHVLQVMFMIKSNYATPTVSEEANKKTYDTDLI